MEHAWISSRDHPLTNTDKNIRLIDGVPSSLKGSHLTCFGVDLHPRARVAGRSPV